MVYRKAAELKNGVLHVQPSNFLCIITEKRFQDLSEAGDHYFVSYDGIVVRKDSPYHTDVLRGRLNNNTPFYLSGLVLGCSGTTARSLVHLFDIEHSRYVHPNELMSGHIGDVDGSSG